MLQGTEGFVNFSEIAKVLDTRPSKLLYKKHIPDIVHNFQALCGVRVVQKRKDKIYFTHPGVAVAAIKILKHVSPEKIHEWECSRTPETSPAITRTNEKRVSTAFATT